MDRLISIEVFVLVVDCTSLTAAANKMNISRSMATRHIAALEKSLGVRLLHRSTRSLGLTNAGKALLPFCRNMLAQREQLYNAALLQQREPKGKITLASSFSFGQLYLAQAVERFMALYPKMTIDLHLTDNTVNMLKQGADIAIEISNQLPEQLIAKKLGDCPSVVCATPEYLAKHGNPQQLNDIQKHNCLVHQNLGTRWNFVPIDRTEKLTPEAIEVSANYSVNDTTILLNATLANRGLSCLPLPFIQQYLQMGLLQTVLPNYTVNQVGIWALYASRHYQPKSHRYLLDFLQQDLTLKHGITAKK